MTEILDHVLRPALPWRDGELTECGKQAESVASVITRDAVIAKFKAQGKTRAAMSTCMTCWQTAAYNRGWAASPTEVIAREAKRAGSWNANGPETQLDRELRAIAALVAAHREEFDGFLTGLEQTSALDDARRDRARRRAREVSQGGWGGLL